MQAVLLYLDPKGKEIFIQSNTGSAVDHLSNQVKAAETTVEVPVLKAKIKELQAQLEAKEVKK